MIYEAIDMKSPFIKTLLKKVYIGTEKFLFLFFGNHCMKPPRFSHTYNFMALVHQVFCIRLSHDKDIKLYDGPGPLSRPVNITHEDLDEVCFSRYMGYAEILRYNISMGDIPYWINSSESYSLGLCEKTIGDDNSTLHFTARDTGAGVHCSWRIDHMFDEMQIHDISFKGYDMFSFHANYWSDQFSDWMSVSLGICQYGGLHVVYEQESIGIQFFDQFSLCNSIYNRPKLLLPDSRRKGQRAYVIFTTFEQYSTGHMEVTLMRFPACELYTVSFPDCRNDDFFLYFSFTGDKRYSRNSENIPHCKNFWISNNLGKGRNRFLGKMGDRCLLTFIYRVLFPMDMIGSQKIVIHNWIIPQTQYIIGTVDEDYYNFMMNATVSNDFPSNVIGVQQRVIVQRDKVVEAFLNHLIGLAFHTNISFTDLHATVVQIQFFQSRVCRYPMKRLQAIPSGIKQLFFDSRMLRNSNLRPVFESLGKNNCSFMLKGKPCESDKITYEDVIIDHWFPDLHKGKDSFKYKLCNGYNRVYHTADVKLNISIHNETQQCSEACKLDITIQENLNLTPNIVRMLKWENIKTFLWGAQLTYVGFRLHIDQKCSSPCDHMYDVAVEIIVYHEEFNCLMPYKGFAGEISSEAMGSWNDANAYCEQKGMQMLSLYIDDDAADDEIPFDVFNRDIYYSEVRVDDTRKIFCSQIKHEELQLDELTVFVGLYKSSR